MHHELQQPHVLCVDGGVLLCHQPATIFITGYVCALTAGLSEALKGRAGSLPSSLHFHRYAILAWRWGSEQLIFEFLNFAKKKGEISPSVVFFPTQQHSMTFKVDRQIILTSRS